MFYKVQRYHSRQYIGHERGGYKQQSDKQPIKGRDASLQHLVVREGQCHHRYYHNARHDGRTPQ
ncbi:MAG: hypothetical protein IJK50_02985 [Prevotella sp.]|nr:hypothetical protein [Prevotella sp.]